MNVKCIPLGMIKKRNRPKKWPRKYHLEYTKHSKTTNDFMLQGSSNRTLTSKINRLCNFSYLSCADIILSRGPSSAPAFFLFQGCAKEYVVCFYGKGDGLKEGNRGGD